MRLELYYDSTVEPFQKEAFDRLKVLMLLDEVKKKGVEVTVTDTASWNSNMLYEVYLRACIPSVRGRYSIRKVFGTTRESGRYFGRQVPALLVFENDSVIDVYPHDEKRRIVTIIEFLEGFLTKLPEGKGHV